MRNLPGQSGPRVPNTPIARFYLVLYLALLVLGRKGQKIFRRDIRAASKLLRALQGQIAFRFWAIGPYYSLVKRFIASSGRKAANGDVGLSRGQVKHVVNNYKAYSGILAVIGSAGNSARAAIWPEAQGKDIKDDEELRSYAEEVRRLEERLQLRATVGTECWKCEFREREMQQKELDKIITRLEEAAEPISMVHYRDATSKSAESMWPLANGNAFSGDIMSTTDEDAPMTSGFFKLEPGDPLAFEFKHHETRIILSGSFNLKDETGKDVRAETGDVMYFPKGAKVIISTENGGLAFCTGQRELRVQ